jgi:glycerate kinase
MKILLALDKFKGSISAISANHAVAEGLQVKQSDWLIKELPISDGGGGALEILTEYGYRSKEVETVNALLLPTRGKYLISENGESAFIEMASICGISDLPHLDPYRASSMGIGLAAIDAISQGATQIIVSLGGSASTDGGLGFLIGIGGVAEDSDGNPIQPNLLGLQSVTKLILDSIPKNISWIFLVDVENPLVGTNGSAYIFGKQKGLAEQDIPEVDGLLSQWADLLEQISGIDIRFKNGAGAAGGVSSVGMALLNARVESGAIWLADLINLEDEIIQSDFVITGEGSFDEQSFMGKGPGLVIDLARNHKKPIYVVAGRVDSELLQSENIPCISLSELAPTIDEAIAHPATWLKVAGEKLAVILNV